MNIMDFEEINIDGQKFKHNLSVLDKISNKHYNYRLTGKLRWDNRHSLILQQEWIANDGTIEWRDVPIVND